MGGDKKEFYKWIISILCFNNNVFKFNRVVSLLARYSIPAT